MLQLRVRGAGGCDANSSAITMALRSFKVTHQNKNSTERIQTNVKEVRREEGKEGKIEEKQWVPFLVVLDATDSTFVSLWREIWNLYDVGYDAADEALFHSKESSFPLLYHEVDHFSCNETDKTTSWTTFPLSRTVLLDFTSFSLGAKQKKKPTTELLYGAVQLGCWYLSYVALAATFHNMIVDQFYLLIAADDESAFDEKEEKSPTLATTKWGKVQDFLREFYILLTTAKRMPPLFQYMTVKDFSTDTSSACILTSLKGKSDLGGGVSNPCVIVPFIGGDESDVSGAMKEDQIREGQLKNFCPCCGHTCQH